VIDRVYVSGRNEDPSRWQRLEGDGMMVMGVGKRVSLDSGGYNFRTFRTLSPHPDANPTSNPNPNPNGRKNVAFRNKTGNKAGRDSYHHSHQSAMHATASRSRQWLGKDLYHTRVQIRGGAGDRAKHESFKLEEERDSPDLTGLVMGLPSASSRPGMGTCRRPRAPLRTHRFDMI